MKFWNLFRPKGPQKLVISTVPKPRESSCCKPVNIGNIDRLTTFDLREFSRRWKYQLLRFFGYNIFLFFLAVAHAEEPAPSPELKVLVLIIASDNVTAYGELQKIWQAYMHSDPHFDAYFIRGNPHLDKSFELTADTLTTRVEESYQPGITQKTILSLEVMLPNLQHYDFVIRTNLSSFYVFPRLVKFLKTLPKQNCYCALTKYIAENGPWGSKFGQITFGDGAGIIWSPDVVEVLVNNKEELFKHAAELPDDVLFGWLLQQKGIKVLPAERFDFLTLDDWLKNKDSLPEAAYHFRAKQANSWGFRKEEDDFANEILIDKELLKRFYPEI